MNAIARSLSGRLHYGWVVADLVFMLILCAAGLRSAPGVLIVPLEKAFGWDRTTISAALAVNLILYGLTGPFAGGTMLRFGIRRTVLGALVLLVVAIAASTQMTQPWHLMITWGVMVGIGSGVAANVLSATVANRWFAERRGVVMGVLTAAIAAGQLIFLPLLATIASDIGWQATAWTLALVMAALLPLIGWLMVEWPRDVGLAPYGATTLDATAHATGNPFAIAWQALLRALPQRDFWLLFASFFVCGVSTNGIVGTHFIAFCSDAGMPEVKAAGILAAMGVFNLIGTTASGWLCDRYDSRWLLFWYYGLRGLSLLYLPFSDLSLWGLGLFSIFYGLDWIATVPPTMRITTDVFGRRDAPIVFGWIFMGHQLGAGLAAWGSGAIRSAFGAYTAAFMLAALACGFASLAVIIIRRKTGAAPAAA